MLSDSDRKQFEWFEKITINELHRLGLRPEDGTPDNRYDVQANQSSISLTQPLEIRNAIWSTEALLYAVRGILHDRPIEAFRGYKQCWQYGGPQFTYGHDATLYVQEYLEHLLKKGALLEKHS